MKALITGINGFAALHLAEYLLDSGDEVMGTVRSGQRGDLISSVACVNWDLREDPSQQLISAAQQFSPDVVFHLAGLSTHDQCGTGEPTPDALAVNVDGTRRLCQMAAGLDSRPRVTFISTGRVYGEVDTQAPRIDESHPTQPTTAYAKTKLLAEQQVQTVCEKSGLDYLLVRAFNHTGPRQLPPLMLPQWCEEIARGSDILHVRNPNVWMDLCDVRDVVRAYRQLAMLHSPSSVYNVGSGRAVRTGEIAQQLVDAASHKAAFEFQSETRHHNAIADIGRLKSDTNWSPQIPLARTIDDSWRYWVERFNRRS